MAKLIKGNLPQIGSLVRLSKNIPKLTRDERDLKCLTDIIIKKFTISECVLIGGQKVIDLISLVESIKFPSSTHLSEKKRYVENLLKAFLIGIK